MKQNRINNRKEWKRSKAYMDAAIIPKGLPNKKYVPLAKPHGGLEMRIIELIISSGEIPTDIYIQMNICHGTFRSVISALYKKKLIKRNISDAFHTYLLSSHGKGVFSSYAPFIKTSNDLPSRKRRAKLARLNAFWLALDVTVSIPDNQAPQDLVFSSVNNELSFISSNRLKNVVTEYPEQIQRSKAYGLLTAFDNQYMIYYEPLAVDFYYEEELFSQVISAFINQEVNDMILMVDSLNQAAFWIYFLLNHYEWFYGDNPLKLFRSVKFFAMNCYADEYFNVLLEERSIEEKVREIYPFPANSNSGTEYHMLFTLDYSKLRYLLARDKYNPNIKTVIVTSPYLYKLICHFTGNTTIKVFCVDREVWDNLI